jgi:ABC-2 type transport system ATP-binding protein
MVVILDVHKSFGKVDAVRGVSFELRQGQVAGLLGPNGAGKTTTIRMITGCLFPDAGRILIGGHDTLDSPATTRRQVGYLPESNPLYPEMKVAEYLHYRAQLFGMVRPLRKRAVAYALDRCKAADVARRRIGTLSKGYRQRVGLAAALIHQPPVLILDEPTNGLDPAQIRETRDLIRELAANRTMLVCSHILPEVERLCDRVIIMAGGKVRADGSQGDLTRTASARYLVQVRETRVGESERVGRVWESLPHVASVVARPVPGTSGLWVEWVLTTRPGAPDIREHIHGAVVQAGLQIREMRSEVPTLETVFMRVLEEADGSPVAPASEPAREAAA